MPELDPRLHLRADCSRCAALCCVAPAFVRSADFAIDKAAGRRCPKLQEDLRCGIHGQLREVGFGGCAVFDCFGAGQQTVRGTFAGRAWPSGEAAQVFEVFGVLRQLHELLWYLTEAQDVAPAGLRAEVDAELDAVRRLTQGEPAEVAQVDGRGTRRRAGELLGRVSEAVRVPPGPDHRGADLVEARLRGADLRRAGLRGSLLLGADLRGADLRGADLLGADLRAADVRAARFDSSLFLTQPQVDAARGDDATILPPYLRRPAHWSRDQ